MKKILNWIYTTIIPISYRHRQFALPIRDKSGWGYRCSVCEKNSGGFPVWHELPSFDKAGTMDDIRSKMSR